MVVVILILLSLGVAGFIMLTDSRKDTSLKRLERRSADSSISDGGSHGDGDASDGGGGDGGGGGD